MSEKQLPTHCVECGVSMEGRSHKKHMASHYQYTKTGGFESLTEDQKKRLDAMGVDY